MVSERGLAVLRVIVQDYVASKEPVGSKSIVERHSFGVSAATIRNDMALLEEEELITAPHTSSGRVPTDKGYRLFVDQLAGKRPLTSAQRAAIETFLGRSADLDEVLARTVRLLALLTNQAAMVQYPTFGGQRVQHIEFVPIGTSRLMVVLITDSGRVDQRVIEIAEPVDDALAAELREKVNGSVAGRSFTAAAQELAALERRFAPAHAALAAQVATVVLEQLGEGRQDRLLLAGTANLVRTEDDFAGNLYPVLEAIEEQVTLLKLFHELETDVHPVSVTIGRENAEFGLGDASVLSSGYRSADGGVARLGVVGPTRMDYSNNMAAVRAVARYLSRLLGEEIR